MKLDEIKVKKIYELIDQIFDRPPEKFIPGKTKVQYAGAYYDQKEVSAMIRVIFNGWFGLGLNGSMLESELTRFIGSKSALLTNSGSSASLLAMEAIVNKYYAARVEKGSEIITPACTFATTASAIVHAGLVPVFVDVELGTYNIDSSKLDEALSKKTRAIFIPHTLGNPNNMDEVMSFAKKNKLIVIEDNCDALGSEFENRVTGSFGALATCSFYPAHHITMAGEGGAVLVNDARLDRIVLSLRNWGRGCWCTGLEKDENGACGYRFDFTIDGIPIDHKYYFTNLGYNLKPVEIQAAMGLAQLLKYKGMMKKRRQNFEFLYRNLAKFEKFFILPKSHPKAKPIWFSFPLTIRDGAPFSRLEITKYLESQKIETRTVFAGNITRQPAFIGVNYRKIGKLTNSDKILKDTFFVGLWPGLGQSELKYMVRAFGDFLSRYQ